MKDRTQQMANDLLERLDDYPQIEVTSFGLEEYRTADPSKDWEVTGAEIEMTAYLSFEEEQDDAESQFRVS